MLKFLRSTSYNMRSRIHSGVYLLVDTLYINCILSCYHLHRFPKPIRIKVFKGYSSKYHMCCFNLPISCNWIIGGFVENDLKTINILKLILLWLKYIYKKGSFLASQKPSITFLNKYNILFIM